MRARTHNTLPLLRQSYDRIDDLADIINRTRVTVFHKLANETFTQREKELIARDLINRGIETEIKETIKKYFGKDEQ